MKPISVDGVSRSLRDCSSGPHCAPDTSFCTYSVNTQLGGHDSVPVRKVSSPKKVKVQQTCPCAQLIKHHAIKTHGGVEV
jgi:hypothetical protein